MKKQVFKTDVFFVENRADKQSRILPQFYFMKISYKIKELSNAIVEEKKETKIKKIDLNW